MPQLLLRLSQYKFSSNFYLINIHHDFHHHHTTNTTTTTTYILYGAARSSCSWRVRSMLEHKRLKYEYRPISLYSGEQHSAAFKAVNPAETVPALIVETITSSTDGGGIRKSTHTLFESLAIIDYFGQSPPGVHPLHPIERAYAIAIAEMIVSGIQPLQNSGMMKVYAERNGGDREAALSFSQHWIETKFRPARRLGLPGRHTIGDRPSVADICLVPQVVNAGRYRLDIDRWPLLKRLYESGLQIEGIWKARPENQVDFDPNVKSWIDSEK
ncbi:Glutathione S-transferase zeta-1 [Tyrophagus putrescentiae]|nr:Glutathione S-transferase zeta-1 [Tyrophagus putrescentiae]